MFMKIGKIFGNPTTSNIRRYKKVLGNQENRKYL